MTEEKEKNGLRKAGAVVGIISGIAFALWAFEGRMDGKIAASEAKSARSMEMQNKIQDLRYYQQVKEVVQYQLKAIIKEMKRNPNDPDLEEARIEYRKRLDHAQEQINKLTAPTD